MNKYLIGSKMLGLNNRDVDYLVIGEKPEKKTEDENDVHYQTEETIQRWIRGDFSHYELYEVFQIDRDLIGPDFPYEFHILDHKDEFERALKYSVIHNSNGLDKCVSINGIYCTKWTYYAAYLTFILENNSTKLTDGQLSICQKIKDKKMPKEYIDILRHKIMSL